jgi:hypothetical protein
MAKPNILMGGMNTNERREMSVEEALAKLKLLLGKGLYPTAIPKVKEILAELQKGGGK